MPRRSIVCEMALDDGARDELRELRRCRPSCFSIAMQRLLPPLQRLGMIGVVLGHLRVDIPADVVEALRRLAMSCSHVGDALLLEPLERDHDVRDLHAGVVDVVLRLDVVAEPLRAADVRVAEDGVAEVADVRGLVRIDVRVLDDHALARRRGRRHHAAEMLRRERAAVEAEVEVARAFDGHRRRRASAAASRSRAAPRSRAACA